MDLFFICIKYTLIKNYKFPLVYTVYFICITFNIISIICNFDWWPKMAVKICSWLWSSICKP